jgi:hypothetical protein
LSVASCMHILSIIAPPTLPTNNEIDRPHHHPPYIQTLKHREISVDADVHPGANGSARVVLGQGATEVLAVVKVRICVCVDC